MYGARWMVVLLLLGLGPQSAAAISIAGCRHPAQNEAIGQPYLADRAHQALGTSTADRCLHAATAGGDRALALHGLLAECDRGCVGGMTPAVSSYRDDFCVGRGAMRGISMVIEPSAGVPGELIRPPNSV
jgi:hypothetical protein